MRCNEEPVLKVPKFKHDTFCKHEFAVYGPLACDCLPKEIRLCDEIEIFKPNLKTHLFVKFVNEFALAIWFWSIPECYPHSLQHYMNLVNLNPSKTMKYLHQLSNLNGTFDILWHNNSISICKTHADVELTLVFCESLIGGHLKVWSKVDIKLWPG